jgi:hypothetical protein
MVFGDGSKAKVEFERTISGPGSGAGQLLRPHGIALRRVGKGKFEKNTVLVADTGNNRICEFDLDPGADILGNNKHPRVFGGGKGSGDGELNGPADCAYLPATEEVAVADTINDRVSIFSTAQGEKGAFVRSFKQGTKKEQEGEGEGEGEEEERPATNPEEEAEEERERAKRRETAERDSKICQPVAITSDSTGIVWHANGTLIHRTQYTIHLSPSVLSLSPLSPSLLSSLSTLPLPPPPSPSTGHILVLNRATTNLQLFDSCGVHHVTRRDLGSKGMGASDSWSHKVQSINSTAY